MDDNQFIDMLYAHGIKFIIKGDILRNRTAFLYFDTPFLVTVYFLDIALTKLLLKIILPDLLRCGLSLLMFLEWIVLVWSIKKIFFSVQNCFR